jgi:hypothetical protein
VTKQWLRWRPDASMSQARRRSKVLQLCPERPSAGSSRVGAIAAQHRRSPGRLACTVHAPGTCPLKSRLCGNRRQLRAAHVGFTCGRQFAFPRPHSEHSSGIAGRGLDGNPLPIASREPSLRSVSRAPMNFWRGEPSSRHRSPSDSCPRRAIPGVQTSFFVEQHGIRMRLYRLDD